MTDEPDYNQVLSTGRKDIPDTLFTIMYSVKPYCVEFIVHQAELLGPNNERLFGYTKENEKEPSDEIEILSGFVKWDGCTNWKAGEKCMVHCCEREHLVKFGEILGQCYDLGKLCPNWCEA